MQLPPLTYSLFHHFVTNLEDSKPQVILDLLFCYFDGVVEQWLTVNCGLSDQLLPVAKVMKQKGLRCMVWSPGAIKLCGVYFTKLCGVCSLLLVL